MRKYFIVITQKNLGDPILKESKRLVKEIYNREVNGIYYRVQTKMKLDNPRRMFIKGDGRIIEGFPRPMIDLVQNIELSQENIHEFVQQITPIIESTPSFTLVPDGFDNYGENFTFFLKFEKNQIIEDLRNSLYDVAKEYMDDDEYEQHVNTIFIPHTTFLYDDVEPEKVKKAQELLNAKLFTRPVKVDSVKLWEVTPAEQITIKELYLRG